jgi:hypothetical protein
MARGSTGVITDFDVVLERALSPEVLTAAFNAAIETEKQRVLAEQTARSGGIAPELTVVVDGRPGGSLAGVRHDSTVVLDWNYLREATDAAIHYLQIKGPIRSGDWRKSIVALINGEEWDLGKPIPANVQSSVVVVTVPYARRLEVGRTRSGRPFVIQVEQHFVEHVSMLLNQRLRDLATFTFGYIDLDNAHELTARWQHRRVFNRGRFSHFAATKRRRAGQVETHVRYPAIMIQEVQAA